MLKRTSIFKGLIFFGLFFSLAALGGECADCDSLMKMQSQFMKARSSRSVGTATKERRALEMAETNLLNSAAVVVSRMLKSRSPTQEELTAVADFLAQTTERDGSHLVLESVRDELGTDFDKKVLSVEKTLGRLRDEKRVTPSQVESVAASIEVVRSAGLGDD